MRNDPLSFEECVAWVNKINQRLYEREFTAEEINAFWANLFRLIPKIKEVGVDNINICTGCGKLNIERVPKQFLACCPDNNYIPIQAK